MAARSTRAELAISALLGTGLAAFLLAIVCWLLALTGHLLHAEGIATTLAAVLLCYSGCTIYAEERALPRGPGKLALTEQALRLCPPRLALLVCLVAGSLLVAGLLFPAGESSWFLILGAFFLLSVPPLAGVQRHLRAGNGK